jgi:hypothetical protein
MLIASESFLGPSASSVEIGTMPETLAPEGASASPFSILKCPPQARQKVETANAGSVCPFPQKGHFSSICLCLRLEDPNTTGIVVGGE